MNMKKSFSEKSFFQNQKKDNDDQFQNMKRSISDKTLHKPKNKCDDHKNVKSKRILITVTVFGSAGPIRFVVNEDDSAERVIETALKLYARQGRLPILGSANKTCFLYPENAGLGALKPSEEIGSCGMRNFVLFKNQSKPLTTVATSEVIDRKGSGWRAWLQKSLNLKIKNVSGDLQVNTNVVLKV